jgi:hypothetical protein
VTTRIPTNQLEDYFNGFTRAFLLRESTNSVDVELIAPDWGDQFIAEGARLRGVSYDPRQNSIEFSLEEGDHRVAQPNEVWTEEEPDGFVNVIEIVSADGSRELVRIHRLGVVPTNA